MTDRRRTRVIRRSSEGKNLPDGALVDDADNEVLEDDEDNAILYDDADGP